ncbi:MAG: dehydrogenase with different specificity related to short-chain alcohol dehydrogenase [Burkholderiales bacterium]|jgi:NAD(P)-dependent dehydrogenase (short-subunit alcohol dehydrogenase family)|nr:dehydrogenase with different specificity related to short-chain alcohol dehydrogenase [Burkholderiales bacterium]
MLLKNKKAIVTGGNQGIGKGVAIALAKAGADVVIQYRSAKDKALITAGEIEALGRKSFAIQSDFTEANTPEEFLKDAIEKLDTVDILVNCAAAYERQQLLEIVPETFAWMQKVNVEIPLRLIQQFAHHLINKKIAGSIINISSIAAIRPIVGSCLISCSKAGLDMLTKCTALELAQYQIRVNGIAPGQTETESNIPYIESNPEEWNQAIKKIPLTRAGKPSDIGELAVFLASDNSSWLTGVTIPVDGGHILSL